MNAAIVKVQESGDEMSASLEQVVDANGSIERISESIHTIGMSAKILALNATVEAARAGEVGRTFAIVAKEVQSLAKQCEDAAMETSRITQNSSKTCGNAIQKGMQVEELIREIVIHQQSVAEALLSVSRNGSQEQEHEDKTVAFDPVTMGTGVESIDDQHRKLFEMVDGLESACKRGAAKEEIDGLLNFMASYAVDHFKHEEGLMDRYTCPVAKKNKGAHKSFIDKYTEWRTRYDEAGHDAPLSMVMELKVFLKDWLVSHICRTDTCLKSCVNRKKIA